MDCKIESNRRNNFHDLAPIVLFAYSRPEHTRRTIEALQQNSLSQKSDLIIYSDAASEKQISTHVQEVRDYLKKIEGFQTVTIHEREKNYGLAENIIDGITTVVSKYGKVIVLEDDIITGKYFLKFMNDALNFYDDKIQVMHISGWNYPISTDGLQETFLWKGMNCWGWATWKRAWDLFTTDIGLIESVLSDKDIHKINFNGAENVWDQFLSNKNNLKHTWAIFWLISIYINSGLCLNPASSMCSNIGQDGSGMNSKAYKAYSTEISESPIYSFCEELSENLYATKLIEMYLRSKNSKLTILFNKLQYFFRSRIQ